MSPGPPREVEAKFDASLSKGPTFSFEERELAEAATVTKYARSSLDEPTRARIRRKLQQAFAELREGTFIR